MAGIMMNFCLTVIFLGLTFGDHFVEFKGTKLNAVRAERMRAQRRTA